MGLRFYRRFRILPGLRLNLLRSGVSTSIGGRGHWLTFGKRGTRATLSALGTGWPVIFDDDFQTTSGAR
jgi:hypothetical protein